MKKIPEIIFVLSAVFLVTVACGIKGSPVLPVKDFSLSVTSLKAEWRDNRIHLEGSIVDTEEQGKKLSRIAACKIYHAVYASDSPPCENCPIDYRLFQKIKDVIDSKGAFSCRISAKGKKGIHFFKVRLVGPNGEVGPFSDDANLKIEDHDDH